MSMVDSRTSMPILLPLDVGRFHAQRSTGAIIAKRNKYEQNTTRTPFPPYTSAVLGAFFVFCSMKFAPTQGLDQVNKKIDRCGLQNRLDMF